MSAHQLPFRLRNVGKRDVRSQFGALPFRIREGKVQVLLISSRGTGRWIIPKGWPMNKSTPAEAAAIEAYEEAGVTGRVHNGVIGFYTYSKREQGRRMPVVVAVFPLLVQRELMNWPERGQRKRKWVSRKKAAKLVDEPELKDILRAFTPEGL
ncbi:NUDIX hydrolase [Maritimibacter sp. DP1N21-5]|uniref:NUDIX hydrolase n=1 Tax=Maritimibacter sp. DP1N21-5 TaxID=2836867 RepID=UPI001C481941|nr:NUDIX hydrolase [Maritimibacter sp. DP1N21-5]MBV7409330.1 NUDIX hydrolase [Maritimibacter sp. DP1N21-5]